MKNNNILLTILFTLIGFSICAQTGIEWQKCLGGFYDDYAFSGLETTDGGYIVAGYSSSNDGNVSGNHGGTDYWVVKLESETVAVDEIIISHELKLYPNPASDVVEIKSNSSVQKIEIYNQVGQVVKLLNTSGNLINMEISELEPGIYFVKAFIKNQTISKKLVVE